MTDFRVLTDTDVQNLLRNASQSELSHFISTLSQTFKSYSLTDEATHQPHRTSVTRSPGQTTLFMPSTSPESLGVKIVGIPPPTPTPKSHPPPTLEATMTVCTSTSKALGTLNASSLTAFRTSLGAMLLFTPRRTVSHIVMFGAGTQAHWHIRLATLLRGPDIRTITIVNRSPSRAAELLSSLRSSTLFTHTHAHIVLETLTPDTADYDARLEAVVRRANTIHCAVPSTAPLFPAAWLEDPTGALRSDLYVSAIGSYRLDMRELDPGLLRRVVRSETGYVPERRVGPVVVVDSRAACFVEAGEVVEAALTEGELMEIGEVVGLRERQGKGGEGLEGWLRDGLVVYKSVGIGVMDLCIATVLFELAAEKGVGVCVKDF